MKIISFVAFLLVLLSAPAFSAQIVGIEQESRSAEGPISSGLSFTWSGGIGSSNGSLQSDAGVTKSLAANTSLMLSGHSGRFELGAIADGYIGIPNPKDELAIFYGVEASLAAIETSQRRLQIGLRAGWASARGFVGREFSDLAEIRYRFSNWAVGPVMRFSLGNASQSSLGFYVSALYCFGKTAAMAAVEDTQGNAAFQGEISNLWLASAGLSWRLGL